MYLVTLHIIMENISSICIMLTDGFFTKKTMILVLKYSLTIPTLKVLLWTLMNLQLFYKFQKNKYVKILESKTRDSEKYITHLQNIF